MTPKEKLIAELISHAHNEYLKLEIQHPADQSDWCNAIHQLQRILATSVARTVEPYFVTIRSSK